MSEGEPGSTGTSPVCGVVRFLDATTADRRVRGHLGIWKDGTPGPLSLAAAQLPVVMDVSQVQISRIEKKALELLKGLMS